MKKRLGAHQPSPLFLENLIKEVKMKLGFIIPLLLLCFIVAILAITSGNLTSELNALLVSAYWLSMGITIITSVYCLFKM